MDRTDSNGIRYPQISGSRKRKGLTLKISPPILQLAKRMAEEKKEEKASQSSTTANTIPSSVPVVERKETPPSKSIHRSTKVSAMLAVGVDGFTLGNPVESVVYCGTCDNGHVAKEILNMNVQTLRTYDKRSYQLVKDIKKSYIEEFKGLHIIKPEHFEKNICCYCNSPSCHRWNVSSGLSYFFNVEFNAIPH